jgi:hypothetical protein
MHRFTVDYQRDKLNPRGFHKGFFLHGVPRLTPLCRLFGHRPVIDGTEGFRGQPGSRWVCCDRCGVRPEPQGSLDADLAIGQPYTGAYTGALVMGDSGKPGPVGRDPGPWPEHPTGAVGAEVAVGAIHGGASFEVKVGNAGSEHTLAAHVHLGRALWLSVNTQWHGTWLQRRLNPTGYESKVTGLSLSDGLLSWRLWARRNGSSSQDPKWMQGYVRIDLRDKILGPARYSYENQGDPTPATVRMPHGDDHTVMLQLQRRTFGRERGRKTYGWTVDCDAPGGIPTKRNGRGRITGLGVDVTDAAAREGTWAAEAAAKLAVRLTADRTRYGWRAEGVSA